MLKINQNIFINADVNTIWAYLTDFSLSLRFNRFHVNLELPQNYSLGKMDSFKINHNFGFGNYDMVAEIKEFIPPNRLSISEFCKDNPEKGFPHSVVFEIFSELQRSRLSYTISGTYGRIVQDMSFKPILKSVIKDELLNIKNAIESLEKSYDGLSTKSIKPI